MQIIIIVVLVLAIGGLANKYGKLKIENSLLYTHNETRVEMRMADDTSKTVSIDISYFIRKGTEEYFSFNEQVRFIEKSLRASGYVAGAFRESEFRSLVRDRGLESIIMVRRQG